MTLIITVILCENMDDSLGTNILCCLFDVAMITFYVKKMVMTCSPIIRHFFDTIFVVLTDKGWSY